jgi:aspartate/methionine/tyrosine aminotransferase
MMFPKRFSDLPEYAFPRLRSLLDAHAPGGEAIHMTIGEPRHARPDFVGEMLAEHQDLFGKYPNNDGAPELLSAITDWVQLRFGVALDPTKNVMALSGTREGLMNACIALSPETKNGKAPVVLTPNPFYQVYAVAAATVGAEPVFVPATRETGFLPDYAGLPAEILDRTTIAYICSPSNPQGAIAPAGYLEDLIGLAEKHDFKVFADECYSEIYSGDAPVGAIDVAQRIGADPERLVIFHSLSKRSNLPGLRSGFVASGPENIKRIKQLRAYSGAPMPQPVQLVSARIWADEDHVRASRALYVEKFKMANEVLSGIDGAQAPLAGFFLWLPVEDGETATMKLWTETGVRVLPGAYLSRDVNGENPGKNYIRAALVAPLEEAQSGLIKLRDCLYG